MTSRLIFAVAGLWVVGCSETTSAVEPAHSVMVPMRDGVKLATDVYLPEGNGPFPVVLTRTTYNKGQSAPRGGDPYLTAGVALVVQDTRGRFQSEGIDPVFRTDRADGHDTLQWILDQDWCNGKIATVGSSALGIVQYMMAPGAPRGLASMAVRVATPTLIDHGAYPDGVFRDSLLNGWLILQNSRHILKDMERYPDPAHEFWESSRVTHRFGEVDVPTVHTGGWYDIFTQGTIDAFVGYRTRGGEKSRSQQYLIIGPWNHGSGSSFRITGEQRPFRFPNARAPRWVGEQAWTLHHLGVRPIPEVLAKTPRVQYYVMGDVYDFAAPGNEWRFADDWPPPATRTKFHLGPGGTLGTELPSVGDGFTEYRYDPENPCPTRGGRNLLIPAGPQDQRSIEKRDDVIVFETPELAEPMEITGRVTATIFASADTPDTDVMVRVCDVYPDGKSILLLDGATRLSRKAPYHPGTVVPCELDLWSTSVILNKGHRVRVSVTSSNAPRYRVNPNDGSIFGEGDPRVANVKIHHSAANPSFVELPIAGR